MRNRVRCAGDPAAPSDLGAELFGGRPRDSRPDPRKLMPGSRNHVIGEQDGERGWDLVDGRPRRPRDGNPPLGGEKWFHVTDQATFAIAGFWTRTTTGKDFSMVTCETNELVAPIHPKPMVTILHPDDVDARLRGSYDEVIALQRPYPADAMTTGGSLFATR